ncbi:MAG: sulfotransferase, partial [Flavobacteriales bacterium]|nr:sulfotransferase [Flavobacteriales bacterium]
QVLKHPIFMASLPRTGTTKLLHSFPRIDTPFTAMSLWEIILAPSIIQKKIYRFFWFYSPFFLKKAVKNFDKILFRKLNNLHRISFFKKEEDEMIMMWALASVYMSFFYPESFVMRDLFRFEMGDITEKRKLKIIKLYHRLVQRHLYALGEETNKRFLSKNPSMASRIETISTYFPDAKIIVIERDPCNVFPSTEALQKLLFKIATDVPISKIEKKAIYKILEDFRLNLQLTLVKKKILPFKVIRFNDLINNRELVLIALLKWIDCENIELPIDDTTVHKTKALYKPLNNSELIKILRNPWPAWPKENYLNN